MRRKGEVFPKTARLRKRSEFLDLFRKGRKVHTAHFVFFTKTGSGGESRLGVTVSAKVGKAVVRNRIKRLLREFFRRHRRAVVWSGDIVIVAKRGAGELTWPQVCKELQAVLILRKAKSKE